MLRLVIIEGLPGAIGDKGAFINGNMRTRANCLRDQSGFWGDIHHLFYRNIQKAFLGIRENLEIF